MSPLESPESSTPIITRAVAAGLQGQYADNYPLPGWQKAALKLLGRLPQSAGRFAVHQFERLGGVDPRRVQALADEGRLLDSLIAERLSDYTQIIHPGEPENPPASPVFRAAGPNFRAAIIGAGLGGPASHLALALGAPFLPQAFVMTLRGGAPDGDVQTYFRRSADLARRIAAANPHILTIQHYDPVHDGWMTRFANHLRLKLLDLPPAYAAFLRQNVQPGGAVVYLDCGATWQRYRVGERSVFQVGGWGDISAQEFLEGSARLRDYCRAAGLKQCDWQLPGYPLETGPESEWGVEPGLGAALESFCEREGFRFVRLALPEPHDYSRLAFRAQQRLLEKEGRPPQGVLIEMFSQFDATAARRAGLLPLWLVFNTHDSRRFLESMLPHFPPGKPVFFSPLITFSHTPDIAPWEDWAAALDGLDWRNIGARASHYPADAARLPDWAAPLRAWAAANPAPITAHLSAAELAAAASAQEQN